MKNLSVLVVDDSHDMLEVVRRNLDEMGLNPFTSDTVLGAIDLIDNSSIDLIITDLNIPEIGGIHLIKYISQHHPEIPILVITGFPNVENAVEVMKLGALEYLIKPFTADELKNAVQNILSDKNTDAPIEKFEKLESFHGIIGISNEMQKLYQTIERTKNNKATVMISGESGTGKEMVARAIHYNSNFSSAPFVAVNCGAIPDQLLESELFGHVKGAFTGAITSRIGFFQTADKGTIFLDEISNASAAVQAKLLRVIQEREVTMLGSNKSQKIDVRIISASNVNLMDQIENNQFREDLYYRLNVVTVNIPPLRERIEDIPLLINYFNKKYSRENNKKNLKISTAIVEVLKAYTWPGNIRELENLVHRLVILNDAKVEMKDLPEHVKMSLPNSENNSHQLSLAEVERLHILKILAHTNNNKTQAANILGIDRKTLREKIK